MPTLKRNHKTPKGYRLLRQNEIIRKTDKFTAYFNDQAYVDSNLISNPSSVGMRVKGHTIAVFYRKVS